MSAKLMDHLRELTVMKKEGLLTDSEFKQFKGKLIAMSNDEMIQQSSTPRTTNGGVKKEKQRRPSSTNMTNPSPNSSLSCSPTNESHPPGSWKCRACGNVNWPMRSYCNRKSCQRPRAPDHKDVIVPDTASESEESRLYGETSPTATDSTILPPSSPMVLPSPAVSIAVTDDEKCNTTTSHSSSSEDDGESSTTTSDIPFKFGSQPAPSMFEHHYTGQQIPHNNAHHSQGFVSDHGGLYSRSAPTQSTGLGAQYNPQPPLPAHLQHLNDYMQQPAAGGMFDFNWPTGQSDNQSSSLWWQQS